MKLELKHLAPYLPYGLNILYWNGLAKEYIEILQVLHYENRHVLGSEKHKPILRPLSDLTKEITHNSKNIIVSDILKNDDDIDYLDDCGVWVYKLFNEQKIDCIELIPFGIINKLREYHFDIFGLIEQGLAIDINTLND